MVVQPRSLGHSLGILTLWLRNICRIPSGSAPLSIRDNPTTFPTTICCLYHSMIECGALRNDCSVDWPSSRFEESCGHKSQLSENAWAGTGDNGRMLIKHQRKGMLRNNLIVNPLNVSTLYGGIRYPLQNTQRLQSIVCLAD